MTLNLCQESYIIINYTNFDLQGDVKNGKI